MGSFNARSNSGLKYAEAPGAALDLSKAESKKAVVAAKPASAGAVSKQLDAIEQDARVVNGKSFYQNGTQWIDSTAQNAKAAKSQRIKFASAEYFDLLAKNAEAAQWLALGQNVQFTIGDTLYDVFD